MSRYCKQTLQRLRNRIDITQLIKILDIPWKMRLQKILLQPPGVSSQWSEVSKSR